MRQTKNYLRFNPSQRHALDTGRNLAVRANDGSGKTSVLVERIVQLLAESLDTSRPRKLIEIVAITFTRKAAGELQAKLREAFEELAATAAQKERGYWLERVEEVPQAMIGT